MTTVAEALALLHRSKAAAAPHLRQAKAAALAQLSESQHRHSPHHTPSGPRRRHEGIEDDDQGIVAAEASASGATVTVSLLAAGFVVGTGGASVRAICAATGADIRSFTESLGGRRVRVFVLEGKHKHVAHALQLIAAAVERYCALTGGAYCNQQVEREQVVGNVTFIYSPPPRAAVPYAAALKAPHGSPPAPIKPPGLLSPRTAGKENHSSGSVNTAALLLSAATSQAAPLHSQPLHLLATPSARVGTFPLLPGLVQPLPPFAQLSRSSSASMSMEVDDAAATPAYRTTPNSQDSYSLFSGSGLGVGTVLFGQPEPFGDGGSAFRSALETPVASSAAGSTSLFFTPALDTTPDIAIASSHLLRAGSGAFEAQLPHSSSSGEDALLANAGTAGFRSCPPFSSQVPAPAFPFTTPAPPAQPQPSPLMAAGPLGLLPLGAASGHASASTWTTVGSAGPSIWGPPY